MDQKIKWYLSGPMSGIAQCNFPAFYEAAETLRGEGYDIVSPAELDDSDTILKALASPDGKIAGDKTWGDYLARDVKIVADECQGMIFLDGWLRSRGAKLEAFVGLLLPDFRFARYWASSEHRDFYVQPYTRTKVQCLIQEAMA